MSCSFTYSFLLPSTSPITCRTNCGLFRYRVEASAQAAGFAKSNLTHCIPIEVVVASADTVVDERSDYAMQVEGLPLGKITVQLRTDSMTIANMYVPANVLFDIHVDVN